MAGQNIHLRNQSFSKSADSSSAEEFEQTGQVEADGEDGNSSCRDAGCTASPSSDRSDSAIVRIALNSQPRIGHLLDCSHFVHSVYERAGLPYPYASSSDLYLGINNFRRVSSPHAGDLAVWRGHVGIVVDPAERSFLSILRVGPSIDYYDSRYWKRRGKPHFFQYVKEPPRFRSSDTVHRASLTQAESEDLAPDAPASASAAEPSAQNSAADFGASTGIGSAVAFFSWDARFHSARPNGKEIHAALTQASTRIETSLHGRDLFYSGHQVIVFDNFEITQVHLAKASGWVDIKFDKVMILAKGRVQPPDKITTQRWSLRRAGRKSWELIQPTQAIYLPQQAVERIVSHELAQLTELNSNSPTDTHQKAELARVLNLLFTK